MTVTLGYALSHPGATCTDLDEQLAELAAVGVDPRRIFTDKSAGSNDKIRAGLLALLSYARAGDVVVVVALERLGRAGFQSIIDILGEDVADEAAARGVVDQYKRASDGVAQGGYDAYVSVKPTHVGLRTSEELAHDLFAEIATHAAGHGQFMRVEMEDHTTTDATLRIFQRLRSAHDNVGIVLQSRLFRTADDVEALLATDPAGLHVRMVKGIYLEPAEIAHVDPDPIRDAYVRLARRLVEAGAFVSAATHDELVAEAVAADCSALGRPDAFELQVLMGVRPRLWDTWRANGWPVRVYVPYGPEWRAYSQRRLRKNPTIFRHVLKDMVGLA